MFTKSQLLTTAVVVASASSVIAGPISNDATLNERDIMEYHEARGRGGHALKSAAKFGAKAAAQYYNNRRDIEDLEERSLFGIALKGVEAVGKDVAKHEAASHAQNNNNKKNRRDIDVLDELMDRDVDDLDELTARDIIDYLNELDARAPKEDTKNAPQNPSSTTPHRGAAAKDAKHKGEGRQKHAHKSGHSNKETKHGHKAGSREHKRPGSHVKGDRKTGAKSQRVTGQPRKDGAGAEKHSPAKSTSLKTAGKTASAKPVSELKTSKPASVKAASELKTSPAKPAPVKAQGASTSPTANSPGSPAGSLSKSTSAKSTAKRELVELIARELGLYDELD